MLIISHISINIITSPVTPIAQGIPQLSIIALIPQLFDFSELLYHNAATVNCDRFNALPFVFFLASGARVADLHNSFTRHAFTAADSDTYPEAHRGGYEQG